MNLQDLEWKLGILASVSVFGKDEQKALQIARDVVSALRAARDLPHTFNADDLVKEVWACDIADMSCINPCGK